MRSKKSEPFIDHGQELLPIDLQVVRHDDGLIDFGEQQTLTGLVVERGIIFFEEAAFAGEGFDNTLLSSSA